MSPIQEIQKAFKANALSVDEIYEIEDNEVLVCISWGDWKHQHLACDHIMLQLGYDKVQEVVTESNGDDAYSSEHSYVRKQGISSAITETKTDYQADRKYRLKTH